MIAELKNVSKYYEIGVDKKREVLNDISLEINIADTIGIIGPSGSGKSTLLNILGTLDTPSSGIVKINGSETNSLSENDLADIRNLNIGFVFQMHHLLPQLNLLENVLVPTIPLKDKEKKKQSYNRALELLNYVGLSEHLNQLPGQLSGGECQRVAVVRSLINEPGIVLADEPTGSLDQESSDILSNLLMKINKDHHVALIVVTHSSRLASKMNRVYSLNNGKLEKE